MTFQNPVDIANRGLQHCGAARISPTYGFTEDSKNASECGFVYDKLRRAELRRNVWRFAIRRAVLRPIDSTFRLLAATLWASGTTYYYGDIVSDALGNYWISSLTGNVGLSPGNAPAAWDLYFGPLAIPPWDSETTYFAGDVVFKTPGDGTYVVYLSLQNSNEDDPATVGAWDDEIQYQLGALVTYASVTYQSLSDFNLNQQPDTATTMWTATVGRGTSSTLWQVLGAALSDMSFVYPIGSGPITDTSTRNVFRLPANFLREAPQDPKAGSVSYLGAPSGLMYTDWELEGNFLVSRETHPIVYRFVADITNVMAFDDMFCEGLAARIGLEVCEALTQSSAKVSMIASQYQRFMSEARIVNGIETGPTEPPEDDYITARL